MWTFGKEILLSLLSAVLSHFSRFSLFEILWTVAHQAPLSWNSPNKNSGVSSHALLQGIFPTYGSKHTSPVSPALQADSLPLIHQGSPEFLAKSDLLGLVKDPHKVLKPLLPEDATTTPEDSVTFQAGAASFKC